MSRPVILGVVGDSATGKTTFTRGLVRLLGEENVTHVCTDDYHRYDRGQRAELNITPLDPDCNYMDIMAQDLAHLSRECNKPELAEHVMAEQLHHIGATHVQLQIAAQDVPCATLEL